MEIIKEPNMQVVCWKCGCEFKFTKEDIQEKGNNHKGVTTEWLSVNCPICNKENEIWKKS
jgi:ribosomal protein S27E